MKTAVLREGGVPGKPGRAAAQPSHMEPSPWAAALGICPQLETAKETTQPLQISTLGRK